MTISNSKRILDNYNLELTRGETTPCRSMSAWPAIFPAGAAPEFLPQLPRLLTTVCSTLQVPDSPAEAVS